MRILIAEDQGSSALILRRALERLGHDVVIATDGAEAWRIVQADRIPVVISDWVMPGIDGIELCRLVRGRIHVPYTYIILLTSKFSHEDRLDGLRAGADDFLVKPHNAEELVIRLEIARRILAVQEELERRNALLAELVELDDLTGIKNRRRFREALDDQFSLARREGFPLSMVMLDVDHFKGFNDSFGHPAGDEVLRRVAALLRDNLRKHDVVARVGGEEFAILLPGAGADAARDLADRLRSNLADHPWPLRAITASLGVSTLSPATDLPATLFEEADRALYASKHRGRDRVTHYSELASEPVEGPGLTGQDPVPARD